MDDQQIKFNEVTPIFRMFDEEKAKEFYLKFLEFQLDWEHRFEANMPLYMQVSYGKCIIHLTEHHGDCCPGAAIRIETENIEAFHQKLMDKNYKYCRSGVVTTPWNSKEVKVRDPFANQLIFYQNI